AEDDMVSVDRSDHRARVMPDESLDLIGAVLATPAGTLCSSSLQWGNADELRRRFNNACECWKAARRDVAPGSFEHCHAIGARLFAGYRKAGAKRLASRLVDGLRWTSLAGIGIPRGYELDVTDTRRKLRRCVLLKAIGRPRIVELGRRQVDGDID